MITNSTLKQKTKISKSSKKGQVFSLLRKRWVDYIDIEDSVEGDGMRRLRELRADGVNIQKKYNPTTKTFQYKVGS